MLDLVSLSSTWILTDCMMQAFRLDRRDFDCSLFAARIRSNTRLVSTHER